MKLKLAKFYSHGSIVHNHPLKFSAHPRKLYIILTSFQIDLFLVPVEMTHILPRQMLILPYILERKNPRFASFILTKFEIQIVFSNNVSSIKAKYSSRIVKFRKLHLLSLCILEVNVKLVRKLENIWVRMSFVLQIILIKLWIRKKKKWCVQY